MIPLKSALIATAVTGIVAAPVVMTYYNFNIADIDKVPIVLQKKVLDVPYYHQLLNENEPYGTCGISSAAMVLGYWSHKVTPDELYAKYGKAAGQSPTGLVDLLIAELNENGHPDPLFFNNYHGDFEDIKNFVKVGIPVIVHGRFTESGHIIVITGYDDSGFFVNDPFGEWWEDGYDTSVSAKSMHYSYKLMHRMLGNDGDIWYTIIILLDGQ